ncbi:MAG TPA: glycosyltransferase [Gemmataceae bacterium]|nr:glycosyltransferase [Gemmataceae bacterium]
MAQPPAVSVIVPARNEGDNIGQVLERLLRQDTAPREIIVTDAGSVDATREIIKEFIRAGHPVRLLEDADALPGRARNLAISQAKGPWVAMTDAGTVTPPGWLGSLVTAAEQGGADVVFGSYEPVLGSFFQECLALAFVPPAAVVDGRPYRGPTTASLLLRREVWDSLGRFPEHLRACEDLLFFERLAASSWASRVAPEATIGWKLPGGFRATFRRFRLYSLHTLIAGLGRTWHRALGRNLLAAGLVVALAVLHHWAWLGLLVLAVAGRVYRSVRTRRPWLKLRHRVGVRTYLLVGLLLLWIDLAAVVGGLEYLVRLGPFRAPGRSGAGAPLERGRGQAVDA